MNRAFRSLWNQALGAWVAVPETASTAGSAASSARRIAAPRLTILALALGSALAVQAGTTLYWDPNGNTAGLGSAGTWDTSSLFWNNNASGTGGTVSAWNNGNVDSAIFSGTAGTVTLSTPITIGNMSFTVTGYTVAGSTLTLSGPTPTITTNAGVSTTVSSVIDGTAGLTKAGTGTLTLSGVNLFSGGVNVTGGTLSITNNDNRLGNSSNGLTMAAGTGLTLGNFTLAAGRLITLSGGTVNLSGGTVASRITGAGGITALTATTLNNNANDYTGQTQFTGAAGTYAFSSIANLGVASALGAPVTGANGTVLANATSGTITLSYTGTGGSTNRDFSLINNGGQVTLRNSGSGTLTLAGNISLGSTAPITTVTLSAVSGDLVVQGVISSVTSKYLAFNASAGRTVTVTGTSTYGGGTLISGGGKVVASVLTNIGVASPFGTASFLVPGSSFAVNTGGILSYTGAATSSNRGWNFNANSGTISNDGTGAIALSGTMVLNFASSNGILAGSYSGAANTASGVISGPGALTVNTAGAWSLSGTNTYTGTTTVSAGTLQAGAAAGGQAFGVNSAVSLANTAGATLDLNGFNQTIGSLAGGGATGGNVTMGAATLTTGGDNTSTTYAGVISGSGGLVKTGTGTQTLSGTNTYTGATTINGGTLRAGAAAGGQAFGNQTAITLANVAGATLDLNGFDQNIASLAGGGSTGGNVSLGAGTLTTGSANTSTSYGGVISGTGGITKNGTGTQILSGTSTYSGATTINTGTLQAGAAAGGQAFGLDSAVTLANTAGATLDLNNFSQSVGALAGGGTTGGNVLLGAGTLTTGSKNINVSYAGVISGSGGLTKNGTGVQTLSGTSTYSGATTINAGTLQAGAAAGGQAFGNGSAVTLANIAGATLDLNSFDQTLGSLAGGGVTGGNVTLGTATLTTGGDNTSTSFAGVISGSGGLIKNGSGVQTLSGTSTYTGATTINAGTLQAGGAAGGQAFGSGSAVTLANTAGATLDLNGFNQTIGSLAGGGSTGGNVTLGAGTLSTGGNNTSTSYAGVISGSGGLTKNGSGVQTLSGTSTYSGATTINAGTVQAGAAAGGQAFGINSAVTLANTAGATLDLNSFDQSIASLDGGGSTGGNVLLGAGTVTLTGSGATTYAGVISGTGGLTKTGTGTQTLSGTNTYTGATTVNAGTLQAGAAAGGQAFGNGSAVTLADVGGATLDLNNFDQTIGSLAGGGSTGGNVSLGTAKLTTGGNNTSTDYAGLISGTGGFTKNGTGVQTLLADNTFAGPTTINAGTVQLGNGGTAGAVQGDIVNNANLVFNRSNTLDFTGSISGAGTNSQIGSGTTRLSGDSSTFSGVTNVTNGTLRINGILGNATSTVNVSNGGTLGGSGTIGGNVAIADGILAPGNSPGTLTINGDLSLSSASVLNYEFGQSNTVGGPLNDLTLVNGNLTLDGTLNVSQSAGGTYGPGLYRVIGYAGTLADNGLNLGTMPAGTTNYIQTSVANQVNLINTTGLTLNFWDGANTTQRNNGVINGGNGTWQANTGNDNWTESTGALNAPYTNGSFAVFAGTAGTVTIDNAQGAVTSGGMQFAASGYVLQGQPLTLAAGVNTIRVGDGTAPSASYTATIAAELAGTGGIDKTDLGTLILSGANSYSGGTTISAGTLQLGDGGTMGSIVGDVTNNAMLVFNRSDNTSFTGTISGTGELVKKNSNTLVLTGTNTYTGATTINAGTLQAGAAAGGQAFGLNSAVTLANVAGATLDLNNFGQSIGSLAGGGTTGGNVTLGTATLTTGGDNTSTSYIGIISGSGGLTKTGTGTQTLSGVNLYTGPTTVNGGTLQAGAAAGGQAFGINSAVTLANMAGATLDLNGFDQTIGSLAGGGANGGDVTLGTATLTTGADNTSTSYAGIISGSGGLTKTGLGTQTLSGASSYTGATAINAGTLQAGAAAGGQAFGLNSAVTLANTAGATLDLNGFDQTIGSLAGGGTTGGNVTLGAGRLTFGTDNTSTTFAGTVSGSGGLSKTGTGSTAFTGNVAVSDVTITEGLLDFSGTLTASTVTMNASNAAGATLQVSGTADAGAGAPIQFSGSGSTLHTVKVLAGGTLRANTGAADLGSGGNTLDVAGTLDTVGGVFNLGAGNDTFTLHDGATVLGTVDGGAGTNTLNTDINTSASLGASVNFQTLLKTGIGTLNITGPQASTFDTVNVQAGTVNVWAAGSITNVQSTMVAAGATLKVTGSYSGGAGNDLLDVAGTLDLGTGTLNLGAGNDTFTLHDGATVIGTVDGGAGTNTLNTDINTSANLGASVNFQTLLKTGTGTLNITGPGTSAFNTVLLQGGTLQIAAGTTVDPQTTVVGSGTNFVVNGTYNGTAGNDTMDVSGTVSGTGTINLLAGDDVLTLHDGAVLNNSNPIDGGAHSAGDTVVLDNAQAFTLDAAKLVNWEFLRKQNAGTATLTGTSTYSGGTDIQGGTLNVSGTLNTPTVAMAGATLQVGGAVNGGAGVATVITGSGSNSNTVQVLAGATLLANTGAGDLGSGGNTLDVAGTLDTGGRCLQPRLGQRQLHRA
ncbi:autotransporter-associated beta strand repeat-containing protein [Burkholderiaceae bacterium UC74_6]